MTRLNSSTIYPMMKRKSVYSVSPVNRSAIELGKAAGKSPGFVKTSHETLRVVPRAATVCIACARVVRAAHTNTGDRT